MRRRLGILAVLSLLSGCHRGWSAQDRQAFLDRCQKKQTAQSCTCVLNALQKTLSAEEFHALSDPGAKGHPPAPEKMAKVREAVMACQNEG